MEEKKKSWLNLMRQTGKNLERFSKNMWGNFAGMGDVVYYLENLALPYAQVASLQQAENALLASLSGNFIHTTVVANPKTKLKLQLTAEIDRQIGLVCCLAHELTLPATIALLGKMHYLSHHHYREQLILAIIGTPVFKDAPLVNDLRNMLGKLQISVCFIQATA